MEDLQLNLKQISLHDVVILMWATTWLS